MQHKELLANLHRELSEEIAALVIHEMHAYGLSIVSSNGVIIKHIPYEDFLKMPDTDKLILEAAITGIKPMIVTIDSMTHKASNEPKFIIDEIEEYSVPKIQEDGWYMKHNKKSKRRW